MFADLEQSLSKSLLVNGRGRTHSEPIGGGRAPKNKSFSLSHYPIGKAPVAFRSKREREREPRRMMMIVTGNKRASSFTPMIENRGRNDAKQVLLNDAKQK